MCFFDDIVMFFVKRLVSIHSALFAKIRNLYIKNNNKVKSSNLGVINDERLTFNV